MTTLANLRAQLNGEVGVATDGETIPWTTTVRNQAIRDGYAALWTAGVWKAVVQDLASVGGQFEYALTTIRRLQRLELIDSDGWVLSRPKGIVQDNGSGGYELRLTDPIETGATIRVLGWTAYKSQFTGDADTDDIPVEYTRIPLLKAKAILYRIALGGFARTGERQGLPPEMNVSVEGFLAIIAAAEREFADEAGRLSGLRPRAGQLRRI